MKTPSKSTAYSYAREGLVHDLLSQSQRRVNLIHSAMYVHRRGSSQFRAVVLERVTYPFVQVYPNVTKGGHFRVKRNTSRMLENAQTCILDCMSSHFGFVKFVGFRSVTKRDTKSC